MQLWPGPLAPPWDWLLPDLIVYSTLFGPTSVTDRVAGPAGPLKRKVTGPDTAISQLPSAQAPTSRPSAADMDGCADEVRGDGAFEEGAFEEGAFEV